METGKIQGRYREFSFTKKQSASSITRIKIMNLLTDKKTHWYTDAPAREVMENVFASEEAIAYTTDESPNSIITIEVKMLL